MQSISVLLHLDLTKVANFRGYDADINITQVMCHVIYRFFGSSLGKVYNCCARFPSLYDMPDFLPPPHLLPPPPPNKKKKMREQTQKGPPE